MRDSAVLPEPAKPRLRGVIHQYAFFVALGGTLLNLFWVRAPKPVTAAVYIALGWVAIAAMPQMADAIGLVGVGLVLLGGVLYTAGAVIYAMRRPNPVPGVFGYHEVFHTLVVAAAAAHFAAVAAYALPR